MTDAAIRAGAYLGAICTWLLALYVLTRGGARRVPLIAVAAMVLLVLYLVGQALAWLAPTPDTAAIWQRATWWSAHAGAAAWLVLVLVLIAEESEGETRATWERASWIAALVLIALTLAFAAVGTLSNAFFSWDAAAVDKEGSWSVPSGSFYLLHRGLLSLEVLAAAALAYHAWTGSPNETPLRARFGWLLVAAVLFTIGTLAFFGHRFVGGLADALAFVLLLIGTLVMGWNVARYGALVNGEVIGRDFIAFAAGQALLLGLYGSLVIGAGLAEVFPQAVLLGIFFLTTTHILAGNRALWLDRTLFGSVAGELGGMWQRAARQPDMDAALASAQTSLDALVQAHGRGEGAVEESAASAPDERQLRVPVETAFRRVNDVGFLSRSPLVEALPWIATAPGSPLDRGRALQAALLDAMEKLRPAGPRPVPGQASASTPWLHYLVLLEGYVEGRPVKSFLQRYHVSESTFHRMRRSAIEAVVRDLAGRAVQSGAAAGDGQ